MKKKAIMINNVTNADSVMDYDDDKGRRRFMVNEISKHASPMYEEIDVPIICLDDDDDLKIDKDYKMFLDHLRDDNNLGPLFILNSSGLDRPLRYEVDNGESETRKFDMFSGESMRSELKNENPMNNRVSQQRKRKTVGFKAEISRAASLVINRESIQRDNRAAERRKRRIALLAREQDNIQRDTKMSESKVESLRDVPLVIAQESIQRDNRVRKIADLKAETLRRVVPLVRAQESIQRDNRAAETRKRRIALLVREQDNIQRDTKMLKVESLRDVPLVVAQESIQRDNRVRKIADLKAETLRRVVPLVRAEEDIQLDDNVKVNTLSHVPLVRDQEDIQRDLKVSEGRKRRLSELEPETLRSAVPLVRAEEDIQRDNKVMKINGLNVKTLSHVPLARDQEDIQRHHKVSEERKKRLSKLEPETLRRAVPLVRAEEDIQRDNMNAERRKREIVETKAAGNSKVVPVELKAVSETSMIVHVTQRNEGDFVGRRKKNEEESVAVVDKDYMSYLTWLVDSLKDSKTTHVANLQNDQSDFNPPVPATLKESTIVPEKDLLVKVKVEQDLESWSDDSDIIAVSDSPFLDGEGTPFVASKSVVDLDKESKEDESRCCLFTKELMDVLKKPYNEEEFLELSIEASMQKPVTRCRELRKGREKFYATDKLGPSYLQRFSDFDKEYKLVDGVDKAKALKLLRGFFFYLRNCSRAGAFKPWSKDI